jgi:hypothetical protein
MGKGESLIVRSVIVNIAIGNSAHDDGIKENY